jgi:hypothetical protein
MTSGVKSGLGVFASGPLAFQAIRTSPAGGALYWLVERPFLKLRDRLEDPSRSFSGLAAAPEAAR